PPTTDIYTLSLHDALPIYLFAAVATRYDLVNDLQSFGMHRCWKRRLIQLARVRPGERALDLCSGTGDVAFVLASQGARVVGLDLDRKSTRLNSSHVEISYA